LPAISAQRFLKDYVAESNDAAAATERAFANAFTVYRGGGSLT
jgi:hypothetical protein